MKPCEVEKLVLGTETNITENTGDCYNIGECCLDKKMTF